MAPIMVEDGPVPALRREDSEEAVGLHSIPSAEQWEESDEDAPETAPRKRRRVSEDQLFVGDDDLSEGHGDESLLDPDELADDDKKKMAMDTTYDGFSIYGRVLCLVVKKRNVAQKQAGQAIMEDWITSTQVPVLDEG